MTLIQSQGHQTYNENVDPKQGYNHVKVQDLALTVSKKRQRFLVVVFLTRKYLNPLPLTCANIKNSDIFMICFM